MAANMAGTRGERVLVVGKDERRDPGRGQRIRTFGLVMAVLVSVLIGVVAMHEQQTSRPAVPMTQRGITGDGIRFQEENTITLPSAGTSPDFTEQRVEEFDALTAAIRNATNESNGSTPALGSAGVVCPMDPTDRPLCYTLLPDGTKVMAPVDPNWTGEP